MELTAFPETAWARGRLGLRSGAPRLLFGRMHEDSAIELGAFHPGVRVFCIASAGCTAIALSSRHEVVAVDINPVQAAYARSRFSGEPARSGSADALMSAARRLSVLAGWSRRLLHDFLGLSDPAEQMDYWRRRLDGPGLRAGLGLLLSRGVLRAAYAPPFLRGLPRGFGRVLRERMERAFSRHSNRDNPYARGLLMGEWTDASPPREAAAIRVEHADAASFLEGQPAASFDAFTLSNVLDGASATYRGRLFAAVRRAGTADAVVVLRSFADPPSAASTNRAAEDRSILWGTVHVRPAASL